MSYTPKGHGVRFPVRAGTQELIDGFWFNGPVLPSKYWMHFGPFDIKCKSAHFPKFWFFDFLSWWWEGERHLHISALISSPKTSYLVGGAEAGNACREKQDFNKICLSLTRVFQPIAIILVLEVATYHCSFLSPFKILPLSVWLKDLVVF